MAPKIVRVQLPVAPNIFDHLECETFARTSGRGGNSGSSWLAGRRNCVINSIAVCMWFLCFPDTNNSQSALRSPLGVRLTACGIYLRTINYYKCRGPRHPDPGMDSDPDPDPVAGPGSRIYSPIPDANADTKAPKYFLVASKRNCLWKFMITIFMSHCIFHIVWITQGEGEGPPPCGHGAWSLAFKWMSHAFYLCDSSLGNCIPWLARCTVRWQVASGELQVARGKGGRGS